MNRGPTKSVITGTAVLSPLADSPSALLQALLDGKEALTTLDETPVATARIADFDVGRYANARGMRVYNRATRVGIAVAQLALRDAGVAVVPEDLGVVAGWGFAHLDTLMEYDRGLVIDGVQRTNPALMPLALPSAPGAVTALALGAKAFSVTLSDGALSSLDGIGLGARLIAQGRAQVCVVLSSLAHSEALLVSGWRAGVLAPVAGVRVFDRASAGSGLGEGAAAIVLESEAHARARGANFRGRVLAQASRFDSAALLRASHWAFGNVGLRAHDLALVSAGAAGVPSADAAEARALVDVLDGAPVPVMAVKSSLGDLGEAGGLVQTVIALQVLRAGQAPPILRFEQPAVPGLHYTRMPTVVGAGIALVSNIYGGAASALLVEGAHE
jgi:3-oxoacyl-[acyl-carrier-protein] synthase II